MRYLRLVLLLTLSLALTPTGQSAAGRQTEQVLTVDHYVSHISTAPAIAGEPVNLYVRERVTTSQSASRGVVLFLHGATYSAVHGFDLPYKDYSWMAHLAAAGFDTFALDMTGYGWSTRPAPMDDPCNAAPEQQRLAMPSPLDQSCPPSFPFRLLTNDSEWADIDAVVDYLRTLRGVERVSLVAWSRGGPRAAGYAALHPEKVDRMVLLAPVYFRDTPSEPSGELPEPGVPLIIATQLGRDAGQVSDAEAACGNGYENGISPAIEAVNRAFDPVGASWGDGIVRAPTVSLWGWNALLAARVEAPTLVMVGEFDDNVSPTDVHDLYEDLGTEHKVFAELACTSHRAQHQAGYHLVQNASLEWLAHGTLDGASTGSVRLGD